MRRKRQEEFVQAPRIIKIFGTFYVEVAPPNEHNQWVGADANNMYTLFKDTDRWLLEDEPDGKYAVLKEIREDPT